MCRSEDNRLVYKVFVYFLPSSIITPARSLINDICSTSILLHANICFPPQDYLLSSRFPGMRKLGPDELQGRITIEADGMQTLSGGSTSKFRILTK
eukprot:3669932-Pleurochrysis_carterae.AAC.1